MVSKLGVRVDALAEGSGKAEGMDFRAAGVDTRLPTRKGVLVPAGLFCEGPHSKV